MIQLSSRSPWQRRGHVCIPLVDDLDHAVPNDAVAFFVSFSKYFRHDVLRFTFFFNMQNNLMHVGVELRADTLNFNDTKLPQRFVKLLTDQHDPRCV